MLNGLDLFSGIGGITLALREWVRPVAYCEIEPYAAGVLFSRMLDGSLPTAPIFPDIRKLSAEILPSIDIIYGGFPCQDVSTAGLRKGLDGERTGLFREAVRLVRECRPKFVFLENVPGIRRYVPSVRGELEALGYDCRDGFLSAAEVGANHIRNRWWLLAHANKERGRQEPQRVEGCEHSAKSWNDGQAEHVADSKGNGLQGSERAGQERARRGVSNRSGADVGNAGRQRLPRSVPKPWPVQAGANGSSWWDSEPDVGRVVNGLSMRVDRIKSLGNSVVPQCAKEAFKRLIGLP